MRRLPIIGLGLAMIALVLLALPLIQTRQQLVGARAVNAELEKVVATLKTEHDAAKRARTDFQTNLDEATSDNEQLRKDIEAAQTQLNERQTQVEEVRAELEKAKTAADEAKAELADREKQLAEVNQRFASEREASERQAETLADLTKQLTIGGCSGGTSDCEGRCHRIQLRETQSQLEPMRTELEKANAKLAELEEKARNAETEQAKLQSSLDAANTKIEGLKPRRLATSPRPDRRETGPPTRG